MKLLIKVVYFLLVVACVKNGIAQEISIIDSSNNKLKMVSDVEFLTIGEGKIAILDETYEPYFSKLQVREIHVFTGQLPPSSNIEEARSFARENFSNAVTFFTLKEKSAILFTISNIKKILKENDLNLIANDPWKFIKVEDWLCGGSAHTRGDYIILSQRHLTHLTSNWSKKMSKSDSLLVLKELGSLLIHEKFHTLQRQYPKKFDSLYVNSWRFEKATIEIDSTILINQLTNPDAPRSEWITNYNDNYYWARTLIKTGTKKPQMGKDFDDIIFTLERINNKFFIAKDSLGNIKQQKMSEFTPYVNSFPLTKGLDHPNEITAYMFSEYFISLIEGEVPFANAPEKSQFFCQEYVNWLSTYF